MEFKLGRTIRMETTPKVRERTPQVQIQRMLNWINKLGYAHYNITPEALAEAVNRGVMSKLYTHMVSWICHELQEIAGYESCVNPTKSVCDIAAFFVELSTFLREVCCHYVPDTLNFANSDKFKEEEWYIILDFLMAELSAARLFRSKKEEVEEMEIRMPETTTSRLLRAALQALTISKPPPTVTGIQLFSKIDSKVKEILAMHPQLLKEPLFTGTLTDKQWDDLDHLQAEMYDDYKCRREVLLKRLDVTVQSFKWGDTGKSFCSEIDEIYSFHSSPLPTDPSVWLANVLAAREDVLKEEKTSGSSVRQQAKSALYKVVIGAVPDRGGRPEDQKPPPPEPPAAWKTSKPSSHGSGRNMGSSSSSDRAYRSEGTYSSSTLGGVPSLSSYGSVRSDKGRSVGSRGSSGSSVGKPDYQRCSLSSDQAHRSDFLGYGSSSLGGVSSLSSYASVRDEKGLSIPNSRAGSGMSCITDYDNVNPQTSSSSSEGTLRRQYVGDFAPSETLSVYTETPSMYNPSVPSLSHVESGYHPGYTQSLYQPMYQPSLGFGGYSSLPGSAIGGYSASGGNYEQNAPFVQNYQSGHGRRPRGGRAQRRGGRTRRDRY